MELRDGSVAQVVSNVTKGNVLLVFLFGVLYPTKNCLVILKSHHYRCRESNFTHTQH